MKTIIEMAREAGLERGGYWEFDLIRLERFANLVRADEREENAKVCEKVAVDVFTQLGREHEPYMKATAEDCAMQIRARGQPKRPWVGLTDDEAISAVSSVLPVPSTGGQTHHLQIQYKYALEIAQTIEAKLKEKNT